jgi:hypothetical protein
MFPTCFSFPVIAFAFAANPKPAMAVTEANNFLIADLLSVCMVFVF